MVGMAQSTLELTKGWSVNKLYGSSTTRPCINQELKSEELTTVIKFTEELIDLNVLWKATEHNNIEKTSLCFLYQSQDNQENIDA